MGYGSAIATAMFTSCMIAAHIAMAVGHGAGAEA
jgi:hypothetical protein